MLSPSDNIMIANTTETAIKTDPYVSKVFLLPPFVHQPFKNLSLPSQTKTPLNQKHELRYHASNPNPHHSPREQFLQIIRPYRKNLFL